MTTEIEITDEMVRVINGDYLVKGIGAREAIRRILVLAEKQRNRDRDDEAFDLKRELAKGFPKLDTTETGTTMGELRKKTGEPYGVSERPRPALRVSAREHERNAMREDTLKQCTNCGGYSHPTFTKCVNCGKEMK